MMGKKLKGIKMKKLALFASILPAFAMATSILPPSRLAAPAKVLRELAMSNINVKGQILRVTENRPYTNYVIGIGADVSTANACTQFVGQETSKVGKVIRIRAMGVADALTTICNRML